MRQLFVIVMGGLFLVACNDAAPGFGEPAWMNESTDFRYTEYFQAWDTQTPIDVRDGEIAGDYGGLALPNSVVADASGNFQPWAEGTGWWGVELVVESDGTPGMAVVDIVGDIDDPQLAEGATFRIDSEDDGTFVAVTGCAGGEVGYWDYDDMASEVYVQVTPDAADPSVRLVSFTADFRPNAWSTYSRRASLEGEFVVRVEQDTEYLDR